MVIDNFIVFFLIVIGYVITLFLLKKTGWGKKKIFKNCNNSCPDCMSALDRIQRKSNDHILHLITFRLFDFRRYLCSKCGWEGLRWEDKYNARNY